MGGCVCVIPNMYMAQKLMAKRSADADTLKNSLYAAEFGKIIITMALFAAIFATQTWVSPVALLAGYIMAQLTHWLTPALLPGFAK